MNKVKFFTFIKNLKMSIQHPLYGNVMLNARLPIMAHRTNSATKENKIIEFPLYEIMFVKMEIQALLFGIKRQKR